MPSSLIFSGLVVLWLLILVPAVARQQQEVARIGGASLAGRVLTRPPRRAEGHRIEEVHTVNSVDHDDPRTDALRPAGSSVRVAGPSGSTKLGAPPLRRTDDEPEPDPTAESADASTDDPTGDPSDEPADDPSWGRPAPRYRPGRGGFDPEANAESARRRYAFRQRMVLALLVAALLTAVVAAAAYPLLWWAHGAIDLALVGYLVYLRRHVRMEAAIRERRAARMAGTRRTSAADDRDLDDWARRGREVTRRPGAPSASPDEPEAVTDDEHGELDDVDDEVDASADRESEPEIEELADGCAEDGDTERVRGVGEPVGLLPARPRGANGDDAGSDGGLPRLQPAPPPPLPPGTALVVVDDDELDLHDLGAEDRRSHRPAIGQ